MEEGKEKIEESEILVEGKIGKIIDKDVEKGMIEKELKSEVDWIEEDNIEGEDFEENEEIKWLRSEVDGRGKIEGWKGKKKIGEERKEMEEIMKNEKKGNKIVKLGNEIGFWKMIKKKGNKIEGEVERIERGMKLRMIVEEFRGWLDKMKLRI